YHIVHPGGRSAEDRPVNAVAAESRRIARFDHTGHSPYAYEPRHAGVNPDFPMTLDLRLLRP
ncbi:MAG TPA: transglutaminase family protein, partial [Polyangiaceae bacterium]|nr:transglutaminase family protein [Polyangiaceae bacterium]